MQVLCGFWIASDNSKRAISIESRAWVTPENGWVKELRKGRESMSAFAPTTHG